MNIAIYLDGVQSILPGEGKKRDRNYREEKLSAQNKHVISMACRLKQQQGGQMIALMVGKKDNNFKRKDISSRRARG